MLVLAKVTLPPIADSVPTKGNKIPKNVERVFVLSINSANILYTLGTRLIVVITKTMYFKTKRNLALSNIFINVFMITNSSTNEMVCLIKIIICEM